MATPLEVDLLGPIRLTLDGTETRIGRLQVRQILGLLALPPRRVWTIDELVDQLWNERLPKRPDRAVHLAVSRLRTALGPCSGHLQAHRSSYELIDVVTDVDRFQNLISDAEGRNIQARVSATETALELWRGRPFADADGPEAIVRASGMLEARRRAVLAGLCDALLEASLPIQVLPFAQRLAQENDVDENYAVYVATALSASGRKVEALRNLSEFRQRLVDSGVAAGPRIKALERTIHESGVQLRPPAPDNPPAGGEIFVGRRETVRRLLTAAADATSLRLVGEAGIGKTATVGLAADRLARSGASPVWVTVDPAPVRPLAPVADAVADFLHRKPQFAPVANDAAAAIGRLLPEQRVEGTNSISRDRFIEGVIQHLARSVRASRLTIIVDDAHLLDPTSAHIFETVASMDGCSVILVSRHAPADGIERLEIGPLGSNDVNDYLAARDVRVRNPDRPTELATLAGGNPLFLRLLVDLELEGGLISGDMPPTIAVVARRRLDALGQQFAEILSVAATLGHRFDVSTLLALRPDANLALAAAGHAGLVVLDTEAETGEFVHGLVADAAYDMWSVGQRVTIHDHIGALLERRGASAVEFVHHYTVAASVDPVRAATANRDASVVFERAHDLRSAAAKLRSALQIFDEYGAASEADRLDVLIRAGRILRLLGEPDHVEVLQQAMRLARSNRASNELALAVVELASHGGRTVAGSTDSEISSALEEAVAMDLDPSVRAQLFASAAPLTALSSNYSQGQRRFHEAVEIVRTTAPEVEHLVLAHSHLGLSHPDDFDQRDEAADRLRMLARDDPDLLWESGFLRFWQTFVRADIHGLAEAWQSLKGLAPQARHRQLSIVHLRTALAIAGGEGIKAERLLRAFSAESAAIHTPSWNAAISGGLLLSLRHQQGRLAEMVEIIDDLVERLPEFTNYRIAQAWVRLAAGRAASARSILLELVDDGLAAVAQDLTWTAALFVMGDIAARLGDAEIVAELYERLLPHWNTMSWIGTCTLGPNATSLATMARLLGDQDGAAEHELTAKTLALRFKDPRLRGH